MRKISPKNNSQLFQRNLKSPRCAMKPFRDTVSNKKPSKLSKKMIRSFKKPNKKCIKSRLSSKSCVNSLLSGPSFLTSSQPTLTLDWKEWDSWLIPSLHKQKLSLKTKIWVISPCLMRAVKLIYRFKKRKKRRKRQTYNLYNLNSKKRPLNQL